MPDDKGMRRTLALLLLVFALTSAGKALTTPAPATASGSEATGVRYRLSTADPTRIAAVTFALRTPASSVAVRLSAGGPWHSCSVAARRATCPVGEPLAGAERFELAGA